MPSIQPRPAFLLAQIGAHAARRFAERVAVLGVAPSDIGVLRMILTNPGRSQQSLAEELGVVPSRVVALLDALEGKGLVERRRNPADRRNYALHLTEEGARVMAAVWELGAAHEDELLAALDSEQRAQLTTLLEAVAVHQGLTAGVHPGYQGPPRGGG
ncbi:MarR family winged helix-turn-helix transcriptional regulator [Nonomuraea typhae]|uniref:MarR family winged helix-turn-helix transcriptional regulator n=1 Tax=Nonomuraea typhae TaxID=2603600 RepID=UPI001FE284AA|nr:MarR family transcriptional regulator [Nonomuraea typhae]